MIGVLLQKGEVKLVDDWGPTAGGEVRLASDPQQ